MNTSGAVSAIDIAIHHEVWSFPAPAAAITRSGLLLSPAYDGRLIAVSLK